MAVYVYCPICKKRRPARTHCNKCNLPFTGKSLSYTIEYYIRGRERRESLGKVSREFALRMERKRRVQVSEREFTVPEKIPYLTEIFGQYVDEKLQPGRWQQSARTFLKLMSDEWPGIRCDELSIYMLRAYRKKLVDSDKPKRTPHTIDRHFACAKAAWNYAGIKTANPFDRIKPFNPKPIPPRIPTTKEEQKLLDTLQKDYPHIYEMVVISICTGLRQSNVFRLKWSEIDMERGAIHTTVKGGKPHVVALNGIATDVLEKIDRNATDYVWVNPKTYEPYTTFKKSWATIRKKTGLSYILKWHGLRHIAASKLINAGASLKMVQQFLAHEDSKTTEIYAHLLPEYQKALVSKISLGDRTHDCTHTAGKGKKQPE